MIHPVFSKIKYLLLYLLAWIILGCIHAGFYLTFRDIKTSHALTIAILKAILFALPGLSIWFIFPSNLSWAGFSFKSIGEYLFSGIFLLAFWLFSSYLIIHKLLFSSLSGNYSSFLKFDILIGILYFILLSISLFQFKLFQQNFLFKEREMSLKRHLKESQYQALKAQINPHFLFNSLNSLSALSVTSPQQTQAMLINLSEYMRYNIKESNKAVPLKQEIENIKRYLAIEQIRFEDKLITKIDFPEAAKNVLVPPLFLQPLIENAVKHGVYESINPVTISITIRYTEGDVKIRIHNNFDKDAIPRKGEGLGIRNTSERLKLFYNKEKLLSHRKEDNLFIVDITIPFN